VRFCQGKKVLSYQVHQAISLKVKKGLIFISDSETIHIDVQELC